MTLFLMLMMMALILSSMPVAFSLGFTGLVCLVMNGHLPLSLVAQKVVPAIDNFLLLAVPFFMLAGSLMNSGGITRRLFRFASSLVGHIPGALGHVNIISSMFFAGMSGSAVADAAGVGQVETQAMVDEGYPLEYSGAVTAASSIIGPIIPPSIPMVLYSFISGVSILQLFVGGFVPGVLIAVGLVAVNHFVSVRRGYPRGKRASLREMFEAGKGAFWALLTPVIILGGIIGGLFTATEASVIAVVYAIIVGRFVYRELTWDRLLDDLIQTAVNTAIIMIIVATASLVAWLVAVMGIPAMVSRVVLSISQRPMVVMLLINVVLLVEGCFLDLPPGLLIFGPVFLPIIERLGISPLYFGIIMVVNLCAGLVTPPVGTCLYAVCSVSGCDFARTVRELLPFLAIVVVVLLLLILMPGLVLWLPSLVAR